MKEKLLNFVDKTRKKILDYFFFELTDPELPTPKKEKKTKVKQKTVERYPTKKYISRNKAIEIADEEQNLRKSLYKEARKAGYDYALIEIIDYCATLVLVEKKYAWYVKVSDGTYIKLEHNKYYKGHYNEYSNISCLIMAETGEYIYLGKDCDTRFLRMPTDDEYLEYIHNVRQ